MITTKEIFAFNIKKIRKGLGLSQEKFAEKTGIQSRNMTDIENAKYLPTPANIDKICAKLKIPVSSLFETPIELLDDKKVAKISQIVEKLSVMDIEKLNIVYNIANYAFAENID